jgi:hypothetical protein
MPSTNRLVWTGVSYGVGAVAMFATRRVLALVWRQAHDDDPPPDGPAAVDAPLRDALTWGISTGAGVAVSRIVAIRSAARVWEATGHDRPTAEA